MTKKAGSEFDQRLEARKGHIPEGIVASAVHVNDTMELAFSSAQQVFGSVPFTAADVIAIYDRIEAELRRQESA